MRNQTGQLGSKGTGDIQMSLNRAAVPLVSILMVLMVISIPIALSGREFLIFLPQVESRCNDDNRVVVALFRPDSTVQLNADEPIPLSALPGRLHEIFRTRSERLLFVRAEEEVAWWQFMLFVDATTPELRKIAWETPELERERRAMPCGGFRIPAPKLDVFTLPLPTSVGD